MAYKAYRANRAYISFALSALSVLFALPTFSQEETIKLPVKELPLLKTATGVSYNIQKYSGFNFITEHLAEIVVRSYLRIKTKAKESKVNFEIFSGWDLIRKKVKSVELKSSNLVVGDIPLSYLEIKADGPIYIKKILNAKKKKKNRFILPVNIKLKTIINLDKVNEVIINLPKWKKALKNLEVSIPPFGKTKVEITKLQINAKEDGLINVITTIRSLENTEAEPLNLTFTGKIILKEKKVSIENIDSQIDDIFTRDSELARSFNSFLEDLINPVFNFEKYEKKGLKIENVDFHYDKNNLIILIDAKKLQHNFN